MILEPVLLSLQVAALSSLLSAPAGVLAAYGMARWRSPLKPWVDGFLQLPLVLPPLVTGYALLVVFGAGGPLGGIWDALGLEIPFTRAAAVLAAAVVSFPLMVRTMAVAFEEVDPRLEEAARSLGADSLRVFKTISLPLARRGLLAGCVLGFARSLGEFGATVLFAGNLAGQTRTIPLAIYHHFQIPGGDAQVRALVGVSIAISLAAMLAAHRLSQGSGR